jgi:ATP-dependent RNA helicase RhlE
MSFDTLGLTPEFVRAVADEGYTEPTPVQQQAIPLVLAGGDLLAAAQTGTGKTAAFVLPILQRLHDSPAPGGAPSVGVPTPAANRGPARTAPASRGPIRVLVLTPTRELALQVEESFRTYGRHRPLRSVAIYGGVGFEPQARALRAGPPIVVATPGRLLDHVEQRTIDLGRVEILVLDEADRMLDMGFIRDIRRILALLPARRQNLLFSATFSADIRALAGGILDRPATVDVSPRVAAAELVEQAVIRVDRARKRDLLSHLVRSGRVPQALVFTRTKHGANKLAEQLVTDGIRAAAIHGNKSQGQRVRALSDFKAGRVDLLVATDIAARGLDIEALPHVVNYELPMVPSDYVHRIGRTGRAGLVGSALSLVCVDEATLLGDIQALLRRTLPSEVVPGFEPDRSLRAEPIRLRSGEVRRGNAGVGLPGVGRPGPGRPGVARPGGSRPGIGRPARPGQSIGDPARAGREPVLHRPSLGRPNYTDRPALGPVRNRPDGPARARPDSAIRSRSDDRGPQAPQRAPDTMPGERLSRAPSANDPYRTPSTGVRGWS